MLRIIILVTGVLSLMVAAGSNLSIKNNAFQYSSAYTDKESHLQYLNARYYDGQSSRFISRDSFKLLNRYAYANGNPIMNQDPSGHDAESSSGNKESPTNILNIVGNGVMLAASTYSVVLGYRAKLSQRALLALPLFGSAIAGIIANTSNILSNINTSIKAYTQPAGLYATFARISFNMPVDWSLFIASAEKNVAFGTIRMSRFAYIPQIERPAFLLPGIFNLAAMFTLLASTQVSSEQTRDTLQKISGGFSFLAFVSRAMVLTKMFNEAKAMQAGAEEANSFKPPVPATGGPNTMSSAYYNGPTGPQSILTLREIDAY